MTKAAGPRCNLACKYCYYLDKEQLFRPDSPTRMTDELLEEFIRQYIQAQTSPYVLFCWHGGESLMRDIDFYKRAIELQQKYGRGMAIENTIQTNGTMLTDEWCRFFKEHNWLVGVSVDGTEDMHNRYRLNRGGGPTFAQVMHGIELLDKHGVDWNAMAVVNDYNSLRPLEFYDFFRSIRCHYLQFTPIVERVFRQPGTLRLTAPGTPGSEAVMASFSVLPAQWGEFLCTVFDEWVANDVGTYFVQLFDATLANWVGVPPGVCTMAPHCGHAGVMEHNGDVYSCDHFVYPEYRLGNLHHKSLVEMMFSPEQTRFGNAKADTLPKQCRECRWRFACNGECPKNRIAVTADGEPGLNYLCEGYRRYFAHVQPYMDFMASALKKDLAPAMIMKNLPLK